MADRLVVSFGGCSIIFMPMKRKWVRRGERRGEGKGGEMGSFAKPL